MDADTWASADAYERFMGRWSRLVAAEFLRWLSIPSKSDWLDVGCGTGALTSTVLQTQDPQRVRAYDLSTEFIAAARDGVKDLRVAFAPADARQLPEQDDTFDVAVSGLALNFVPEPERALTEMRRVTRPGGTVGIYVWDYSSGMEMLRFFWDAAVALNAASSSLDEGIRFASCEPQEMERQFELAGLKNSEVTAIEVATQFQNFEDYWEPFLGGQGPAPGYVASLGEDQRLELKQYLEERLPRLPHGGISLGARAWAARGFG